MKDSSDINALHSQVIFLKIREKSTEELISIWVENNRKAWSQEEFNAIQSVLSERLGKLPTQKPDQEIKSIPVKINRPPNDNRHGESFFNLSPINNARAVLGIFIVIGLCIGSIVVAMVEQNTKIFWDFAQTSIPSQIEKIEIQRIDQNGNGIGSVITIDDKEKISEFASVLKTIQEYHANHPSPNYEVRIKIFRLKELAFGIQHSTIELKCYTMSDEGNTLFVGAVLVKPGVYSYGNGNAKFLAPDLIDWLKEEWNLNPIISSAMGAARQSMHPTLGIRRQSQAVFYALAFSQSDGVPPPAPARVTQTVSPPSHIINELQISNSPI